MEAPGKERQLALMRNISIRDFATLNFALALVLALCAAMPDAHAQTTWSYATNSSLSYVQYSGNPLTPASDGNIYWGEQDSNGGAIYQITPAGVTNAIFPFATNLALGAPNMPVGPLIQGPDGYLYGITQAGGANSSGSFYKVALDGSGFQDLYDFDPAFDGGGPTGGIILGSDGNFYGISNLNWKNASPSVRESTQHPLSVGPANLRTSTSSNPVSPQTSLHAAGQHTNGSLSCGASPSAVFFQLTPAGVITFLYCHTDKAYPSTQTPLVQGSDGNFYGISTNSASSVLFQLENGNFNVLGSPLPTTDVPFAALAGGPDGKFYALVGTPSCGSILQFDPNNSYSESDFADLDCNEAGTPYAWELYLASDGAFYSASPFNTGVGFGSVFRLDMTGTLSYPYEFVAGSGIEPYTAPVQNSTGTFFGTTASTGGKGLNSADSAVYSLTASPALAAPVTLNSSISGTTVTLDWTVNNASPLTPPNCVALVNNSTGVTGWSGMVYGAFSSGVYSGSGTVTQTQGTTVNYQLVCPSQGAASASVAVNSKINSHTQLGIGPASSMVTGTTATLTATVSRVSNCGITNRTDCVVQNSPDYPTGTVTFAWNNQTIGQATLSSGVATLSVNTTNRTPQTYDVTASYSGSEVFNTSSDTESGTLTAIPTTTTLTINNAGRTANNTGTITAGNNATLVAHVTASSGTAIPSGTVTFSSGSVDLGSAMLDNTGAATFNTSSAGVPVGTYTVTASYSGNRTHAAGTSAGVNVVISKATTVTTVSAAKSTVAREQPDQLTATVTSSGDAPTGSVHFLWNNYFICSATITNGSASCTGAAPSTTVYGPYSVTAAYMGDRNNNTSTSLPITVTVTAP
jgi:hypothetical protein